MPHRNRVMPDGRIVAHPARGTFTGNRGILVDRDGQMSNRQWAAKAWITCALEFRGRRRSIAQPRTWTELFFLDEAVAMAAGHRPCAYCRRAEYNRFKALSGGAKAAEMDRILHAERLDGRDKRLHAMHLDDLPDGAFILWDGVPMLVREDQILPFAPSGYGPPLPRHSGTASLLTPPSLIAVLRAGYRAVLHPTARP
ncbi:hypothetical protein [Hasllibacter sp. MH4015]|uniref:hypothetical protein n=1 Tax=Hasllibacter sp. MH4015 TaxID=2854029 RepID=UPI001CD2146C|nr:hypothetical protein [Hasllibacter sp. MH4015]